MTVEDWMGKSCKMPLWQFLRVIHEWTECVKIRVIIGPAWLDEPTGKRLKEFNLTENAFERGEHPDAIFPELERLLKYYADVPVWKATAHIGNVPYHLARQIGGETVHTYINANCEYMDVRDALAREKEDIRREKRREYEKNRRAKRDEAD